VIVALLVLPGNVPHGTGVSNGRGVGYWLSLIVIVIGLVLSLIRMRDAGAVRQQSSTVGGNPGRGAGSGLPPPSGPPSRPPGTSPNPPPG